MHADYTTAWHFWRDVAIGGAILLALAAGAAGQPGRTVYYQVTFSDGSGRDVSTVPETHKGITRVLRIVRIEQGVRGYEILSTGPQTLTLVSRGQTYRTDLAWDGRAWVAPEDAAPAVTISTPSGPDAAPARAELLLVKASLLELAARLLESHEKLAAAEKGLDGPQADAVAKARQEVRGCAMQVLAEARKLSGPDAAGGQPGEPTGRVEPQTGEAPKQAVGIVKPIDQVACLPHRVQVWKLPAGPGRRTYHVSAGHPEAGAAGAFYYVAYADTTGDGRPDQRIARSDLARAEQPGQWTQWAFTTDCRDVYVGKAWDRPDTVHYHTEAVRIDDNWRGLSSETYVSVDAWGLPAQPWLRSWGNLRVWNSQP